MNGLKRWERIALVAAYILCCLGVFVPYSNASTPGFYVSAGKTTPGSGGDPVGTGTLGYRGLKYDLSATYIAEAEIYDGAITVPDFVIFSVARHWSYPRAKFLGGTPTFLMGLSFKGSDRCAYNGEEDCNRRMPLPVNFHFGIGMDWKDIRIELFHDSNNAMDHGPERKNLGANWLSLSLKL